MPIRPFHRLQDAPGDYISRSDYNRLGQMVENLCRMRGADGSGITVDMTFGTPILNLQKESFSQWREVTIVTSRNLTGSDDKTLWTVTATSTSTLTLLKSSDASNTYVFAVFAQGGDVTLTPSSGDTIQGGSASYTVNKGLSCLVCTDGAGAWWLYFLGNPMFKEVSKAADYTATIDDSMTYFVYTATGHTLTLPHSTTLSTNWMIGVYAKAALTIAINGSDNIEAGTGVSLVVPAGWSGWITTDAAGNFYTFFPTGWGGVTQRSANHTLTIFDQGQLQACSGTFTLKLPAIAPGSQWKLPIQNWGTGNVTIDPNGNNLDNSASVGLLLPGQGIWVFSDGTNYWTERGIAYIDVDYYQTVQVNGTAQTQEPILDLIDGYGLSTTPADDAAGTRTKVTHAVHLVGGSATMGGDVPITSATTFYDAFAITSLASGNTYFVAGQVTIVNGANPAKYTVRIWDPAGTVYIEGQKSSVANEIFTVSLSTGVVATSSNLNLSVASDTGGANGTIKADATTNSAGTKVATKLVQFRIA